MQDTVNRSGAIDGGFRFAKDGEVDRADPEEETDQAELGKALHKGVMRPHAAVVVDELRVTTTEQRMVAEEVAAVVPEPEPHVGRLFMGVEVRHAARGGEESNQADDDQAELLRLRQR